MNMKTLKVYVIFFSLKLDIFGRTKIKDQTLIELTSRAANLCRRKAQRQSLGRAKIQQ